MSIMIEQASADPTKRMTSGMYAIHLSNRLAVAPLIYWVSEMKALSIGVMDLAYPHQGRNNGCLGKKKRFRSKSMAPPKRR